MKLVSVVLAGAIIGLAASMAPIIAAAAAPPVACFNAPGVHHCDTMLDITHADITALLVGCDPQKGDRVLVNGKPEDGELWTLFGVSPAQEKPIDPIWRKMLTPLNRQVPVTYPELRFRLKPGYYNALTVSVGECSFGPIQLTTTDSSGDRHLVLIRQPNSALPYASGDGMGGIYGYAPLPGLQITLTGGEPQQTLVARNEVDSNPLNAPHGEFYMYFFDAVKPGHYTMTVSGYGWTKSLGDVTVSRPGDVVLRYIYDTELGLPKAAP
jgi:hypothetical protein